MSLSPLQTLARYLAGEFENTAQAAAEPAWYVHLRLWQRPVASLSTDTVVTFFLEQANVISGQPPYRQRILQIRDGAAPNLLEGQYFALSDPLKFQGGGGDPSVLHTLTRKDLVTLPNSGAAIHYQQTPSGYQFQSALKDNQLCSFEYGGKRRYVYLGFEIGPTGAQGETVLMKTFDKGIDPDTGRGLWGALMGPFQMVKQTTYATGTL